MFHSHNLFKGSHKIKVLSQIVGLKNDQLKKIKGAWTEFGLFSVKIALNIPQLRKDKLATPGAN